MKLKYLSFEFLLIFLCLVLPPLFTPASAVHAAPRFGWAGAQSLVLAVLLALQLHHIMSPEPSSALPDAMPVALYRKKCPLFQCIAAATVCFGILMLIYAAVELGGLTVMRLLQQGELPAAERTVTGVRQWLSAATALAAGAFYEECLYRAFLPDVSLLLLARALQGRTATQEGSSAAREGFFLRHEKVLTAVTEGSCALLFAFSHRYLGIPAVINALLCGIVLRICYQKTGRILCGTAAHGCYNLTLLAFASLAAAASTAG
ncbi:MAG: CPBP family intramembrane metalloprotease [Treponema sp.]|nr:CPBP family intramembrane metalloprotease [Treponema sp.]